MFKNKKGSMLDLFFIVSIMFAFAIIILVGWLVMSNVNDKFQTKLDGDVAKTTIQESTNRYVDIFDGIFLFVFFGSFIGVIIGSLFLDTHPAFFIVSIIILIILCILVAIFANAYGEIASADKIRDFGDDFTFIPFIMQYFVQIIIVMFCSVSIALYSKSRSM